jgi:hypothetical protein
MNLVISRPGKWTIIEVLYHINLDFLTLAKCETTPLFAHGKELAKLWCDSINRSPHRTRPAHASSESLAFFCFWGSELGIWGLRFGFWVKGLESKVYGSGFKV